MLRFDLIQHCSSLMVTDLVKLSAKLPKSLVNDNVRALRSQILVIRIIHVTANIHQTDE